MKYSSITSLGQQFRTYGVIIRHNVFDKVIIRHNVFDKVIIRHNVFDNLDNT
jgi:hypothetical protein